MFSSALRKVEKYTFPIIESKRLYNGSVSGGLATFVLLNSDGWLLTAAHILRTNTIFKQNQLELKNLNDQISQIKNNAKLSDKSKQRKLAHLKPNPLWITNFSYLWSLENFTVTSFIIDDLRDIAIGKIDNFDSKKFNDYPLLGNPKHNIQTGTSLCKLGFPFHNVNVSFDDKTKEFNLASGTFPAPRFPLDGIFTRNAIIKDLKSDIEIKFIEMSSPGLRGQSGGPIFDVDGVLWGLQSRTVHIPLGFNPKIKKDGKEVEENQFINLGIAISVDEIIGFLDHHKIKYNLLP